MQNDLETKIEMLKRIGELKLSDAQKAILSRDVGSDEIGIKPKGAIYLPWSRYADILNDAFSREWLMVPDGLPQVQNGVILYGHYLLLNGHYAGYAIGEQEFGEDCKLTMTYGEAIEAAKSNSLMRLCKGLGIGLCLWDSEFVDAWKAKYAETYEKNGRTYWRKKRNVSPKVKENPKEINVEIEKLTKTGSVYKVYTTTRAYLTDEKTAMELKAIRDSGNNKVTVVVSGENIIGVKNEKRDA